MRVSLVSAVEAARRSRWWHNIAEQRVDPVVLCANRSFDNPAIPPVSKRGAWWLEASTLIPAQLVRQRVDENDGGFIQVGADVV